MDWASRDMRWRHEQVEAATNGLSTDLQRAPTDAELAERLGLTLNQWLATKSEMQRSD
jgi:DNA-directed RNA polymerase specialized sigma subunit